jgi:hypothetical protein
MYLFDGSQAIAHILRAWIKLVVLIKRFCLLGRIIQPGIIDGTGQDSKNRIRIAAIKTST